MTKEDYEGLHKLEDWQLLDRCGGAEQDSRSHAAKHIIATRRAELADRASRRAAVAARWSAIAACVSALVAMVLVAMVILG
jgi:hypothetical protein